MSKDDLKAPAEKSEAKPQVKPHRLKSRVRIMGKWQDRGYRPSAEEIEAWQKKCKRFNLDLKTGAPKKQPETKKK